MPSAVVSSLNVLSTEVIAAPPEDDCTNGGSSALHATGAAMQNPSHAELQPSVPQNGQPVACGDDAGDGQAANRAAAGDDAGLHPLKSSAAAKDSGSEDVPCDSMVPQGRASGAAGSHNVGTAGADVDVDQVAVKVTGSKAATAKVADDDASMVSVSTAPAAPPTNLPVSMSSACTTVDTATRTMDGESTTLSELASAAGATASASADDDPQVLGLSTLEREDERPSQSVTKADVEADMAPAPKRKKPPPSSIAHLTAIEQVDAAEAAVHGNKPPLSWTAMRAVVNRRRSSPNARELPPSIARPSAAMLDMLKMPPPAAETDTPLIEAIVLTEDDIVTDNKAPGPESDIITVEAQAAPLVQSASYQSASSYETGMKVMLEGRANFRVKLSLTVCHEVRRSLVWSYRHKQSHAPAASAAPSSPLLLQPASRACRERGCERHVARVDCAGPRGQARWSRHR